MSAVDNLRNSLISKLLAIKDQELLSAIDKLLSKSAKDQKVSLSKEQIQMLQLSDEDLENDRLIPQERLFERERQWLKDQ